MNYNYIDLFHGIGGFALGAHCAGMKFKNHFCSDIEPYAQELYKLRFPDSVQLGDITKIDTEELKQYGDKWIITGGFPCQDISIAGKGEGITGSRSGLWFEYWRIIRDLRPRFAIMENVGALVNWFDCERRPAPDSVFCESDKWSVDIRQIQAITTVISNLAEIGYNAEWQDIRAEDVGAPHKRERIWIVAYSGCESERWKEKFKRSHCEPGRCSAMQHGEKYKGTGQGEIPNTDSTRLQGRSKTGNITKIRQDRKQQFERQDKFFRGENWSIEPSMGRLAHGIPCRVDRLKGLGNAIVPQIAEILFIQIKNLL